MSDYACNDTSCRGNAPCLACRLWLTERIHEGVSAFFNKSNTLLSTVFARDVTRAMMASIREHLGARWPSTVGAPAVERSKFEPEPVTVRDVGRMKRSRKT